MSDFNFQQQASWTLSDWLLFYEQLHPVGIDMGLARVAEVWQRLNISHIAKRGVITVAGTNGKGSACKMLTMLIQAQGYQVGTYTSPHLFEFNERIQVNQQNVSDTAIIEAFKAIEVARKEITLSYFEATTLAGLVVFAMQEVDYAVLEVGLGGRLDAINVIDADAAMITSIGVDHEAFLGRDLAQIAIEKAGVFRTGKPAVYASENMSGRLLAYCQDKKIPLTRLTVDYQLTSKGELQLLTGSLQLPEQIRRLGQHQLRNAAGVYELLSRLKLLPDNASEILTDFAVLGRVQQVGSQPDIIIDVAHNPDAAKALASYIASIKPNYRNIIAVIGMLNDKDQLSIFDSFSGLFDHVYLGALAGERGTNEVDLKQIYEQSILTALVTVCPTIRTALIMAKDSAQEDDVIICFGSFLVASEVLVSLKEILVN